LKNYFVSEMKRRSMKYLLFILILVSILITAGCVGENQNSVAAPTPQIVYVTVLVTPTLTPTPTPAPTSVASRDDPVIGTYRYYNPETNYDDRVRFNADGTFIESLSTTNQDMQVFCGVWNEPDGSLYSTFAEPNRPKTFIYSSSCGEGVPCISDATDRNANLHLFPYTGAVDGVCVPPTPVAVEGTAQIISEYSGWKSYGSFFVTGLVRNNVGRPVTAQVNVDYYDADGVKLGTGTDSVTMDPYGQSRYEAFVFGRQGGPGAGTYTVHLDNIN
jgi:hypothetical protein